MGDRTSSYWDGVARERDSLPAGWRRHARGEHLRLIRRWGEPEGRWLKTDLFEERSPDRALLPALTGAEWVGLDVSRVVAQQARDLVACRPVVADVLALPFGAGRFDGVLSTSTLDHFTDAEDIDHALLELRRVLRRGGRLVLTLDNPTNPLVRLRNSLPPALARRTGLVPFEVGHTYDEAGGRAALDTAGFDVDAVVHLLHAPHVVGTRPARFGWYERSVLPRSEWLGGTRVAPVTGHYVAFSARAR